MRRPAQQTCLLLTRQCAQHSTQPAMQPQQLPPHEATASATMRPTCDGVERDALVQRHRPLQPHHRLVAAAGECQRGQESEGGWFAWGVLLPAGGGCALQTAARAAGAGISAGANTRQAAARGRNGRHWAISSILPHPGCRYLALMFSTRSSTNRCSSSTSLPGALQGVNPKETSQATSNQ